MDYERYQNLHTIIMLRDILRKWWRAELTFASEDGTVIEWAKPNFSPPPNDFCRLALFSKEGMRRCCASAKVLNEKFKAAKKSRRSQFHECHLGFTVVGAPVYIGGEYTGMLCVEGFARQQVSPGEAERLKAKITELNAGATDLGRAVDKLLVLGESDVEKICDLLEFGANEIGAYEGDQSKNGESLPAAPADATERYRFENIVGQSAQMAEVFRVLERVCNSDSTVLVNGESGTGKELVARAIHYNGLRAKKPFVVQNCSAFNDNLLESALFGHAKGSFTGAIKDKKGLFEIADGGTFFLDEVGDMSPTLQVKLLRVLQEGTLTPVGSNQTKQVDVRVIAATHKDLADMVKKGTFREDLYYRINVIRLVVPPLRNRREDLPLLIDHFLRKHKREGQRARGLAPETLATLSNYPWPGNIRELENEIERLLVLGSEFELLPADLLSSRIREAQPTHRANGHSAGSSLTIAPDIRLNDAVEQLEREIITQGLSRTQGNKSRLARELGISRSNLILKIQKYQIADTGDDA
jgi:two-component system, NtrC family, response regulator HupR/HoxA